MNKNGLLQTILVACVVIMTGVLVWMAISHPIPTLTTPGWQQQVLPPTSAYPPNYPLNMEITSYIGRPDLDESFVPANTGDKLISVVHKVTYDESVHRFVYHYKISFIGKEKCFLSWELLDRVFNSSQNSTPLNSLIELEPEKIREFSMQSEEPPALYEGFAWIYKKKILQDKSETWELIRLNAQPGPLPRKVTH